MTYLTSVVMYRAIPPRKCRAKRITRYPSAPASSHAPVAWLGCRPTRRARQRAQTTYRNSVQRSRLRQWAGRAGGGVGPLDRVHWIINVPAECIPFSTC